MFSHFSYKIAQKSSLITVGENFSKPFFHSIVFLCPMDSTLEVLKYEGGNSYVLKF